MKTPTLTTLERVTLGEIAVRDRLRPVSEAAVESLVASITELGVMKDAIHIRKRKDGKLVLIAGGHRLEAPKRLGWTDIPAKVWTDVTDDWARLMEVDDNIAGAELNPLDTAVFLAERKAIFERLHPEAKRGGDRKSFDFQNQSDTMSLRSFTAATAEKFAMSERHVKRLVAAGRSLGADAIRLRGAKQQVTLKDLTEISKIGEVSERHAVIEALVEGSAKSAGEARRAFKAREAGVEPVFKDPVEEAYRALIVLWARAPKAAKRRFAAELAVELDGLLSDAEDKATAA
jgi:ParB family transcriptional regulator, chromosome partitioning protein